MARALWQPQQTVARALCVARDGKTRSEGRIAVLVCIGDESGASAFAGIDHHGPAFLGMECLRALGCCVLQVVCADIRVARLGLAGGDMRMAV